MNYIQINHSFIFWIQKHLIMSTPIYTKTYLVSHSRWARLRRPFQQHVRLRWIPCPWSQLCPVPAIAGMWKVKQGLEVFIPLFLLSAISLCHVSFQINKLSLKAGHFNTTLSETAHPDRKSTTKHKSYIFWNPNGSHAWPLHKTLCWLLLFLASKNLSARKKHCIMHVYFPH